MNVFKFLSSSKFLIFSLVVSVTFNLYYLLLSGNQVSTKVFSKEQDDSKTDGIIMKHLRSSVNVNDSYSPLPSFKRTKTFLLVMVLSTPKNVDYRNAIRSSWKHSYENEGKEFMVRFVVGTAGLNSDLRKSLTVENGTYNDLVLLKDLVEDYSNLTRKVLKLFEWASKNVDFGYLMKTDEDCFARLDKIQAKILEIDSKRPLYMGKMAIRGPVHKDGKWKEESWSLCDTYIPYAYGSGYVLSGDLVRRIVVNADGLVIYNNEDVSVGVWVSAFEHQRIDYEGFSPLQRTCKEDMYLLHSYTPSQILNMHSSLTRTGKLCV